MPTQSVTSRLSRHRTRSAWLFLLPMLATVFVVAAWPLGRTIGFSFTDASLDMMSDARWVGVWAPGELRQSRLVIIGQQLNQLALVDFDLGLQVTQNR